jgi:hypothetical protein
MASRRPTVTLIVCCVAVLAGIAIKYDSSQDESSAKALADPKGMGPWPGKTQAVIAPKKSPIL